MKNVSYGHEDLERDRGFLTDADRELLITKGQNLGSDQSRRNARRRVRDRTRNAIIDFDILARHLAPEDRRQIFEESEDEWQRPFQAGQKAMIEFLYTGLAETDPEMDFETILRSGVHDAVLEDTPSPAVVNVTFDVETEVQYDIDSAREKFEGGDALTISDIGALIATGEVSDQEELQELADAAQENSVIQSSISPMQAQYVTSKLQEISDDDEDHSIGEETSFPVSDAEGPVLSMFSRSEPIMLYDAATDRGEDPLGLSKNDGDDEDSDDGGEASADDADAGGDTATADGDDVDDTGEATSSDTAEETEETDSDAA